MRCRPSAGSEHLDAPQHLVFLVSNLRLFEGTADGFSAARSGQHRFRFRCGRHELPPFPLRRIFEPCRTAVIETLQCARCKIWKGPDWVYSVEKLRIADAPRLSTARRGLRSPCRTGRLRWGQQICGLSEVLGGGCEVEFVAHAAWAAQPGPVRLRRRVLPVGIGPDQAGIRRTALTTRPPSSMQRATIRHCRPDQWRDTAH